MTFVGVQFADDSIAVINKNWLTPRKTEAWWPPYKFQSEYDKAAKSDESPDPANWKIYEVKKSYFECDDYSKAENKIINLQYSSDIQTADDVEGEETEKKRERVRPSRFIDDSEREEERTTNKRNPIKRPKLDSLRNKTLQQTFSKTSTLSTSLGINPGISPPPSSHGNWSDSDLGSSASFSERLDKDFQEKFLRVLLQIKEQNARILTYVEILAKEKAKATLKFNLPESCPVTFPINCNADIGIYWKSF